MPNALHAEDAPISAANKIRPTQKLCGLWLLVMVMGCATNADSVEVTIAYHGTELDRSDVSTTHFTLPVFRKTEAAPTASHLWIFIDGDGEAWLRDGLAAEDPTPARPVALNLYIDSAVDGLYLGRACTFGTAQSDPLCSPEAWAVNRYSERAVSSMMEVIVQTAGDRPLVLAGYSGGGVLAAALAARLGRVEGLLTVAANLDVSRWVTHHAYAQEIARRAVPSPFPLTRDITQLHVFGGADDVAPFTLSECLLQSDNNAHTLQIGEADHICCWRRQWPGILARFQQLMEADSITPASLSDP